MSASRGPPLLAAPTVAITGLELLVSIAGIGWLYVSQTHNLKRLKAEREAKSR